MRHIRAWWLLAEELCAGIASPAIDIDAADREVEAILRASRLWSSAASIGARVHAAWLDSSCRRLIARCVK